MKFLIYYILFVIFEASLYPEDYDIHTGITIHDQSALDSYLEKDSSPLSQHAMCELLTKEECPIETKIFKLHKDLQKYLISLSPEAIRQLEYASKRYWEYALLSDAIYNKNNSILVKTHEEVDKSGWRIYKYYQNINGLVVGLYQKNNNFILAIGGTTANSKLIPLYDTVLDIWTDLTLISETFFKPHQLSVLKSWYMSLPEDISSNIIAITGHSLGGGLAQYMGLMTGKDTYTFNTAPLPLTYESSQDLNGGYAMGVIKTKIEDPYEPLTNEGSTSDPNYIYRHLYFHTATEFLHKDKITNIMSKNDPLTNILKYTHYVETSGKVANIILKESVLKGLKERLGVQPNHPLVSLIVGNQVELPLETGHSMSNIRVLFQAINELSQNDIYVLSDSENGKYYAYLLSINTDSSNKKILSYETKYEPLIFNNINLKTDWVYRPLIRLQELGLTLHGKGNGDFDKDATRSQGEILLIIAKLFYGLKIDYGDDYLAYYNFIGASRLPSFVTPNSLNNGMTRGDMAILFYHILYNRIPKHLAISMDTEKGWYLQSATLKEMNIVGGYNDGAKKGFYGWDDKVSQAESLAIIVSAYEYYIKVPYAK